QQPSLEASSKGETAGEAQERFAAPRAVTADGHGERLRKIAQRTGPLMHRFAHGAAWTLFAKGERLPFSDGPAAQPCADIPKVREAGAVSGRQIVAREGNRKLMPATALAVIQHEPIATL